MRILEVNIKKDIPISSLRFVKVPSIFQLEKYRKEHPIDSKQKMDMLKKANLNICMKISKN